MLPIRTLHKWHISPKEAILLQKELRTQLRQEPLAMNQKTRLIAGLDVSCTRFDPLLTAGVIVWDRETNTIVDQASAQATGTYPYIPGLLSFREIPVLLMALEKITVIPDIFFVDGQGIAHPRRMGIAAHVGLLLERPTVGVGKSRLTGIYQEPGPRIGDQSPLMDHDEQIGTVLRTKERSNPLFISPGHLIDQQTSVALVLSALRGHKLPEPTRLAHLYVNAVRTGQTHHEQLSLLITDNG